MNFPAESARLGNLLAIWFWTYHRREQGVRAFVARTEHMDPWLDVFPALREFVLERSAIPFTAHRSHEMPLGFEEERRSALETFSAPTSSRLLCGRRVLSTNHTR